jgi:hypothetical protein
LIVWNVNLELQNFAADATLPLAGMSGSNRKETQSKKQHLSHGITLGEA